MGKKRREENGHKVRYCERWSVAGASQLKLWFRLSHREWQTMRLLLWKGPQPPRLWELAVLCARDVGLSAHLHKASGL